MKLSKHSKIRMRERTEYNHKERVRLFRDALNHGRSPNDVNENKEKELRKYLERKSKKSKVKLYKGYVFVYSKSGKQLYTMYKLPETLMKGDEKE